MVLALAPPTIMAVRTEQPVWASKAAWSMNRVAIGVATTHCPLRILRHVDEPAEVTSANVAHVITLVVPKDRRSAERMAAISPSSGQRRRRSAGGRRRPVESGRVDASSTRRHQPPHRRCSLHGCRFNANDRTVRTASVTESGITAITPIQRRRVSR
jgi:hypothetical protein